MSLVLEPVTRQGMIPLIGVYGRSGSGKTHSALLLARGLAGTGKIAIIETENKRSGALADLIPGGFERVNLDPPFEPENYIEAVRLLESQHFAVGVIDSLTHEWDGEGGILELQEAELQRMAGDNYSKREACKMAAWIKPKQRHKQLLSAILRCKIPLVCCLRGQEKVHMTKVEGRTAVEIDKFTTPIFDSRFIFEMLVNLETVTVDGVPGCANVTKWTHADLLKCVPAAGKQIAVEHGAAIARWCLGTSLEANAPAPAPASPPESLQSAAELRKELWAMLAHIRGKDRTWATIEKWLVEKALLGERDQITKLDAPSLRGVIKQTRKVL